MAHRLGSPRSWIIATVVLLWLFHFSRGPSKGSRRQKYVGDGGDLPNPPFTDTYSNTLDPIIYNPYPDYNSPEWLEKFKGPHIRCHGPRNVYVNGDPFDMVLARLRPPQETDRSPVLGSYEVTGLDASVCFDARSRYRPYGFTDEDGKGIDTTSTRWDLVDWGSLQKICVVRNKNRYHGIEHGAQIVYLRPPTPGDFDNVDKALHFPEDEARERKKTNKRKAQREARSAIIFQVPTNTEWTIDTIQYMRSLIMEMSLHTGGEYELVILVGATDDEGPIFEDLGTQRKLLESSVPREFIHLATMYNTGLLRQWYPKTHEARPSSDPLVNSHQALQLLSIVRPDLEYFWSMDIDARYTGHHYDLFPKIASWAKAQTREKSWEKASLVFVPDVHNSWKNFTSAAEKAAGDRFVDAAVTTEGIEAVGPAKKARKSRWGQGEEADLITVGPIFDPLPSQSGQEMFVENYPDGSETTPRRAISFPNMTRISKRLLRAMHHGQVTLGASMPPSMYAVSTALHHGLKVAAFPLPVFVMGDSSPEEMEDKLNGHSGRNTFDLPYRFQDLWRRMTFTTVPDDGPTYADQLYKRWVGYDSAQTEGLCLPGMMLHPVRDV